MRIFCQYCGNRVLDSANFCSKCGKKPRIPLTDTIKPSYCRACGTPLARGMSCHCYLCGQIFRDNSVFSNSSDPFEAFFTGTEKRTQSSSAKPEIYCMHCGSGEKKSSHFCARCGLVPTADIPDIDAALFVLRQEVTANLSETRGGVVSFINRKWGGSVKIGKNSMKFTERMVKGRSLHVAVFSNVEPGEYTISLLGQVFEKTQEPAPELGKLTVSVRADQVQLVKWRPGS